MNINQIFLLISNNIEYVLLGTIALLVLCLIIFLSIVIKLNVLLKQYRNFMKGMDGKNLEEIMLANRQMINDGIIKTNELEQGLVDVQNTLPSCIRKVAAIRFNAFPDMGSDVSFSVALLDEKSDGIVLSGLTGRQDSRTYAKPIINGKSTYHLTEEEKQALQQACSS